jgi:hypothetical protein
MEKNQTWAYFFFIVTNTWYLRIFSFHFTVGGMQLFFCFYFGAINHVRDERVVVSHVDIHTSQQNSKSTAPHYHSQLTRPRL